MAIQTNIHIQCHVYVCTCMYMYVHVHGLCKSVIISPEVAVHPLEPGLLPGESSVAKDWLEVDPSTLDLVEVAEILVQVCQTSLPQSCLVSKPREVGRVFQRLQQALVISHLCTVYIDTMSGRHVVTPQENIHVHVYSWPQGRGSYCH